MNINLTGHHCPITDALRNFTHDKLQRLTHFGDHITSINVVLKIDKLMHIAEANLHVPGSEIHASASDKDMYAAIDALVDKLEKQIKKHRAKTTNHHRDEKQRD